MVDEPVIDEALVARMREQLELPAAGQGEGDGRGDGDPSGATGQAVTPASAPAASPTRTGGVSAVAALVGKAKSKAKTTARRLATPLARRIVGQIEQPISRRVEHRVSEGIDRYITDTELLRAEVRGLTGLTQVAAAAADLDGLRRDARPVTERLHALDINLELMKAQLATFEALLDQLGFAIAPGAGLVGVPDRFAELRERLNGVDRQMRQLAHQVDEVATRGPAAVAGSGGTTSSATAEGDTAAAATGTTAPSGPAPSPSSEPDLFDYVGFELRFRGDPEVVLANLRDRYFHLLRDRAPVLDVGCGKGELLAALAEEGIHGIGVDLDRGMVAEARAAGVEAAHGDAIAYLREAPEASFGAICAMQVVEHLQLGQLLELLELAATRLVPGGIFIAETPNPATLLVLGNSYILDPTHVWPLHPSLLTFLCEQAGFRDVKQHYFAPASDYQLDLLPDDAASPELVASINRSFSRLNDVLFGAQDYAVVATTPS